VVVIILSSHQEGKEAALVVGIDALLREACLDGKGVFDSLVEQ
jgi:hypothetical protein